MNSERGVYILILVYLIGGSKCETKETENCPVLERAWFALVRQAGQSMQSLGRGRPAILQPWRDGPSGNRV